MKYKVGDKVRVRSDLTVGIMVDKKGNVVFIHHDMVRWRGKVMTIDSISLSGDYFCAESGKHYYWADELLEPIHTEKIVITTDGVTTIARKYDGKKLIKEAKAVCSKDDTFDFNVGVKLAMERLLEEKPKLYNGKVVCVDIGNAVQVYTKGKVYQFRDGVAYNDAGCRFHCCVNHPITSFDDLRMKSFATWLEVVE